jgi:hypothetical protein
MLGSFSDCGAWGEGFYSDLILKLIFFSFPSMQLAITEFWDGSIPTGKIYPWAAR